MSPFPTSKGYLNPGGGVEMTRLPPGPRALELVRHYWIPQWDLPAGQTKRQIVLAYPACNLVVQPGGVVLAGPTTRATHRDLAGRGWAVGALLRPAAGPPVLASAIFHRGGAGALGTPATVAEAVDREFTAVTGVPTPAAPTAGGTSVAQELHTAVTAAMAASDLPAAVAALEAFLVSLCPLITTGGLLANRLQESVEGPPVRQVGELARRLAVSPRTLQRLAGRYVGVAPAAMIRRRRLQDAADEVRRDPRADLATVAVAHGYADHAHLTREFREVLGFTPSQYRAGLAPPGPAPQEPDHRRRDRST